MNIVELKLLVEYEGGSTNFHVTGLATKKEVEPNVFLVEYRRPDLLYEIIRQAIADQENAESS